MTSLFLLDTCVCIDILRQRVAVSGLPPTERCCLSSIVSAELRTGLAKSPPNAARRHMLEDFLSLFPIQSFDDPAARHYADIRADLETKGIAIGPLDLLIAAHARSLDASLVTANINEFRRVKGLKLTAWKQPA